MKCKRSKKVLNYFYPERIEVIHKNCYPICLPVKKSLCKEALNLFYHEGIKIILLYIKNKNIYKASICRFILFFKGYLIITS